MKRSFTSIDLGKELTAFIQSVLGSTKTLIWGHFFRYGKKFIALRLENFHKDTFVRKHEAQKWQQFQS